MYRSFANVFIIFLIIAIFAFKFSILVQFVIPERAFVRQSFSILGNLNWLYLLWRMWAFFTEKVRRYVGVVFFCVYPFVAYKSRKVRHVLRFVFRIQTTTMSDNFKLLNFECLNKQIFKSGNDRKSYFCKLDSDHFRKNLTS